MIYATLAVASLLSAFGFLAFPIAIVLAIGVILAGNLALRIAVAPLAARYWPAIDTGPPPEVDASINYATPPSILYPAFAQARGQCGWVHMSMRVRPDGRVVRYRIIDQAPDRTFAFAAAVGLASARLPPADGLRETTNVITFVIPGETTPAWAQARLAALEAG